MTSITASDAVACPLWRRLLALLYDALAVIAIVMVVGFVCQRVTGGTLITTGEQVHIAWWYQPLQALVVSAYFLVSWLRGGQTLGMRPWRIRVTQADGSGLRFAQALLRLLVAAAPGLMLALAPWMGPRAALWAALAGWVVWFGYGVFDARHRAIHDVISRTELRRIG